VSTARPRVWLVAGSAGGPSRPGPPEWPVLSDGHRRWIPDLHGTYHTTDGRHHANWEQLHQRYDLIEVLDPSGC